MSPPQPRTLSIRGPTDASWGVRVQPALEAVPFGDEFDRTSAAIRCVAAAEIYKLTDLLPVWAQWLTAQPSGCA